MTVAYLLKIANQKIVISVPKNVEKGDVVEVLVNRVFVDEAMKKRIDKKGVVRIY